MEFKGTLHSVSADFDGNILITIKTPKSADKIEALNGLGDKELSVKMVRYSPKRSLSSNSYLWVLLGELAAVHDTTAEELYLLMLRRYGVSVILPADGEQAKENLKAVFRLVIDRGEAVIITESCKEVKVSQMQCYKGSSLYTQAEMTRLLNGVISECHELGISTMTPNEVREMNERWGVNEKRSD